MYRAVRDICSAHVESWNGVPAFAEAFIAFNEKVTLLSRLGMSQSTVTQGVRHQREKSVTDQIKSLILEIDNLIQNHMDTLIRVIQPSAVDFHLRYVNARNVVNYGTRHDQNGAGSMIPEEPDDGN